jgi:hypothetical protein
MVRRGTTKYHNKIVIGGAIKKVLTQEMSFIDKQLIGCGPKI